MDTDVQMQIDRLMTAVDRDGDCVITKDELRQTLYGIVDSVMQRADTNQDGTITGREVLKLIAALNDTLPTLTSYA